MKKILFLMIICLISVQVRAIGTSHSLFNLGLAAADDEKTKSGGKFRDESFKATLAAQWDLLPQATTAQKSAKDLGRESFKRIFAVYPDDIDLTKMSQYISLSELCKQTEEKLKGQYADVQRKFEKLSKDYKKSTEESKTHKAGLGELSGALNNYSRDFKNLFKALKASEEAHTTQAGELTPQELEKIRNDLLKAQAAYNQSLENLHDKAVDFNLEVNLTNNYLNLIVKGELAKYATEIQPAPEAEVTK
jgi:hypothetical protein